MGNIEKEGFDAAKAGWDVTANPYQPEDKYWFEWRTGYFSYKFSWLGA